MAIQHFVSDKSTRDEVFAYIKAELDKHALSLMYDGKDVSGIKDAKDALDKAERAMINEFTPQIKTTKPDRAV